MKFPSLESQALVGTRYRDAVVTPSGELIAQDTVMYSDLNSVTSAATAKSTLKAAHIPASILSVVQGIRITAWGTAKATANNKTQTIDVGGTTFVTTGAVGNNGGVWHIETVVMKKSANVQESWGRAISATTVALSRIAGSLTEGNALLVEVTATNVTDTDGTVCTGFTVEVLY